MDADNKNKDPVWESFGKALEQKGMLEWFKPVRFTVNNFEEEISHAYSSGALHCLKTISLDLNSVEEIRNKVYEINGWRAAMVRYNPSAGFKFYYLLGQPQNPELELAFYSACEMLKDVNVVLLTEDQAGQLPAIITDAVIFASGVSR